jgi:hypothetical protein
LEIDPYLNGNERIEVSIAVSNIDRIQGVHLIIPENYNTCARKKKVKK